MSPSENAENASTRIGDPVRLPGVGTRVDFVDEFGSAFCVVNRDDGAVELYMPGTGDHRATIHLSDASAHALGALLAGRYELTPTLPTRADRVLGGLIFDWIHVPAGGRAAGRTMAELEIRHRTGVTVVAILRGAVPIVAPDPDTRLEAGDDVVIVCRPADLGTGRDYLGGA
jgi:TrkA domain protein